MKKTIFYLAIIMTAHSSCGGNQNATANTSEPTIEKIKVDSTSTGTIKNIWCGSYQSSEDAGIVLDNGKHFNFAFCQGSSDIPGHIMVEGELILNPEAKDILIKEKDKYNANPKYLNKKINVSYWMNGREPVISKINVIGESSVALEPKIINGSLMNINRKNNDPGYFLDIKEEDGSTKTFRIMDDKKGYTTVATIFSGHGGPKKSDCVFIWGSGYNLGLVPDNTERKAQVTLESKIVNTSNTTSMTYLASEDVITKIEWIN